MGSSELTNSNLQPCTFMGAILVVFSVVVAVSMSMLYSFLPVCYAYFLPRKKMRKSRRTIRTTMVIMMDSTIHSQMRDRLRPRFLALNICDTSSLLWTSYIDASL